jgi:hypothetical protein
MTQETPLRATQSAETSSADVGYTEDDAELVTRLIVGYVCGVMEEQHCARLARQLLGELAAAGRLLPEDTRTERDAKDAVLADFHTLDPRIPGLAVDGCHCNLLAEVAFTALRRVGPWVPVPEAPYSAAAIDVEAAIDRRPCGECGPGYWIGDEGCRHGVPVPTEPAPLCSACAGAGWPDGIHACPACGGSGEEKPPNE